MLVLTESVFCTLQKFIQKKKSIEVQLKHSKGVLFNMKTRNQIHECFSAQRYVQTANQIRAFTENLMVFTTASETL